MQKSIRATGNIENSESCKRIENVILAKWKVRFSLPQLCVILCVCVYCNIRIAKSALFPFALLSTIHSRWYKPFRFPSFERMVFYHTKPAATLEKLSYWGCKFGSIIIVCPIEFGCSKCQHREKTKASPLPPMPYHWEWVNNMRHRIRSNRSPVLPWCNWPTAMRKIFLKLILPHLHTQTHSVSLAPWTNSQTRYIWLEFWNFLSFHPIHHHTHQLFFHSSIIVFLSLRHICPHFHFESGIKARTHKHIQNRIHQTNEWPSEKNRT